MSPNLTQSPCTFVPPQQLLKLPACFGQAWQRDTDLEGNEGCVSSWKTGSKAWGTTQVLTEPWGGVELQLREQVPDSPQEGGRSSSCSMGSINGSQSGGPLLPWQTSGLWMTISICNKTGFQFKRSGSLGKSSPEWGACLLSAETQQKAWASSKCSRSGKHFLLAGFLTSPVVFFQQKQEKGRIHLNLMLKYPQKDEAKGTVRSRDRVEIKNTFFLSLSLAHTLYMYIAWSCAIQENNFWRRQYKSGWKGKNKKEDESGLLCLSEPRGSLPGAPDRFFQER